MLSRLCAPLDLKCGAKNVIHMDLNFSHIILMKRKEI